jgi:hypothetical protein
VWDVADKHFGKRGVIAILVVSPLLAFLGALTGTYFSHALEQTSRPGALIVSVLGADEVLSLKLNHRPTDAPASKEYFRIEQIPPGVHLLELFGNRAAVHSQRVAIAGGGDNNVTVDLLKVVRLPRLEHIHGSEGWMYLGSLKGGMLESSVAQSGLTPQFGAVVRLTAPTFLRTSPSTADGEATEGDAFAWTSSGMVRVTDAKTVGSAYWIKVQRADP